MQKQASKQLVFKVVVLVSPVKRYVFFSGHGIRKTVIYSDTFPIK